jgi:multidrug resistance efflux pump
LLQEELSTATASLREAEAGLAQLRPVVPFAGIVRLADCDLREGDALGKHEQIASIVSTEAWQTVAYLDEQDVHLVTLGAPAALQIAHSDVPLKLRVTRIERDAARTIAHPLLTVAAGGDVAAEPVDHDWVPTRAVYRVTFQVENVPEELGAQVRRGRVVIRAQSESLLERWSRNALSLLWREFGF